MLSCGALQRSNSTYIKSIMCFSKSKRDPRCASLIEKKSWKQNLCLIVVWCGVVVVVVLVLVCVCVCLSMCVCVCVCVCVWVWNINSFDIIAIIFKAYKKCKSIKKDFKSAGLLI